MIANDQTAKYNDIVYSEIKGEDVVGAEIELIESLVKPGGRILDVGAGTGRHLVPLLQLGYDVDAVEMSEGMAKALKLKVRNEKLGNKNFQIHQQNFFEFTPNLSLHTYHLIVLMWNSLNEIALTDEDLELFFEKSKSLLSNNGQILINIDDTEKVQIPNIDHSLTVNYEGRLYKQTWTVQSFDDLTNTTESLEKIEVYENDKKIEEVSSLIRQRWWGKDEIEESAKKQGFSYELRNLNVNEECYIVLSS